MSRPVIFAVNVVEELYTAFKGKLFKHIESFFEFEGVDIHMLPIKNGYHCNIETRAEAIWKKCKEFKTKPHLVGFSVAGIDCRNAVNLYGANAFSVTGICSPGNGSALAGWAATDKVKLNHLEPALRMIGLPLSAFQDMSHLMPKKVEDRSDVHMFSISATKTTADMDLLHRPLAMTLEVLHPDYKSRSDGLFTLEEASWGYHLLNFEAEHGEMLGSRDIRQVFAPCYRAVIDNLKYIEDKQPHHLTRQLPKILTPAN
mmetsp:Transcript_9967/g.19732  ORF Transcript_9967/g.19732 Transcript_9967/m.19732 type:complete len:258 (+) Transcript_9967:23-796(+)